MKATINRITKTVIEKYANIQKTPGKAVRHELLLLRYIVFVIGFDYSMVVSTMD